MKIQGQEIIDDGTSYHVRINKPIYGHCVAVNSRVIEQAIYNHRRLFVSCPGYSEDTTPQEWVKKAQIIYKVFRIPNHPMKLYQAHIGTTQVKPEPKDTQLPLI